MCLIRRDHTSGLPTSPTVKVRMWHNPAALATGQPVRLVG
jgi:hypothetical protein